MFSTLSYRKVFFVRFAGYFLALLGLTFLLMSLEPVAIEEGRFTTEQIIGRHHSLPTKVITSAQLNGQSGEVSSSTQDQSSSLGDLVFGNSETITPVSTDFGIVIEKINANARVVANVDPVDEKSYVDALSKGVAHAKGTALPGQKGNIYLFSHSTDAPWNIIRYNAIFYLLNKLDTGDRVILFYQGRRYDYIVFDKTIASPTDTHFLTDTYNESVLTLQTCDPPGTLVNRLLVRAKLASD